MNYWYSFLKDGDPKRSFLPLNRTLVKSTELVCVENWMEIGKTFWWSMLFGVLVPGACTARRRGGPTAAAVPPRVGSARGPPGSLHRHPATTQAHLPQHCIPSAPATLAPRWQGILSPNKHEFSLVSVARRSGAAAVLVSVVSPPLYAAGRLHHHPANQHKARDPLSIVPRRPLFSLLYAGCSQPTIRAHPCIHSKRYGGLQSSNTTQAIPNLLLNLLPLSIQISTYTVVKWKWPALSRELNKLGFLM